MVQAAIFHTCHAHNLYHGQDNNCIDAAAFQSILELVANVSTTSCLQLVHDHLQRLPKEPQIPTVSGLPCRMANR